MYNKCTNKRTISGTQRMIPGELVFNQKISHVGVYIGNGQVVEAKGRDFGVQKNLLKDRSFYFVGTPSWIEFK